MQSEVTDSAEETGKDKNALNGQQLQWEKTLKNSCSRFGDEPTFKELGKKKVKSRLIQVPGKITY